MKENQDLLKRALLEYSKFNAKFSIKIDAENLESWYGDDYFNDLHDPSSLINTEFKKPFTQKELYLAETSNDIALGTLVNDNGQEIEDMMLSDVDLLLHPIGMLTQKISGNPPLIIELFAIENKKIDVIDVEGVMTAGYDGVLVDDVQGYEVTIDLENYEWVHWYDCKADGSPCFREPITQKQWRLMIEKHIDIFGLIPKGLARAIKIDKT